MMKVLISGYQDGVLEISAIENAKSLIESMAMNPVVHGFSGSGLDETNAMDLTYRLELLLKCNAIFMLNGWQKDHSARTERIIAETCGLKVLYESLQPVDPSELIADAISIVIGYDLVEYVAKCRKRCLLFPRMIFTEQAYRRLAIPKSVIANQVNRTKSVVDIYLRNYPDEYKYNRSFREMADDVDSFLNAHGNAGCQTTTK